MKASEIRELSAAELESKLKDLKGKSDWEKNMIARRRKTLAVCSKCHAKIDPDRRIRLN